LAHALGEVLFIEFAGGFIGRPPFALVALASTRHSLHLLLQALGPFGQPVLFPSQAPPRVVAGLATRAACGFIGESPLLIRQLPRFEL
jgi:hypothetical protein